MSNTHREHVMAGIMHGLIVLESVQNTRKHLRKIARTLERYQTTNIEARLIARKAAEGMRKMAEALGVAEEANGDVFKCFGAIVECDLSGRNERKGERTGASEGEHASPDSGPPTPAMTSAPTSNP
jgi:ribosomal protein L17